MIVQKGLGRAILILSLFLALGLRLFLISERAPGGDEIWTLFLTRASFSDIWLGTLAEMQLPFFFSFLRTLSLTLNHPLNILELRAVALLFGILAILTITFLANTILGKNGAAIAFLLSLFLPSAVWTSIFGRYYSFLIFLTALILIVFIRFLKNGDRKHLFFLVGISLLGIYTHYYFFLLPLSLGAYLILIKRNQWLVKRWFYSLACLFLLFTPALFNFFSLPKQNLWMKGDMLKIPASFLTNITSLEVLLHVYYRENTLFNLVLLGGLLGVSLWLVFWGTRNWKNDFGILFLLVAFFPLVVILFVSVVAKIIFGVESLLGLNSLLIFLPALMVLLARGITLDLGGKKILTITFVLLIFASQILFWRSSFWIGRLTKPYDFLDVQLQKGDLVLHADIYTFLQAKYYLKGASNFGVIHTTFAPPTEKTLGYEIIPRERILGYKGRLWYFEPAFYNLQEARDFKNWLDNNFYHLKEQWFEENILDLHLYEKK